jgi:hypothetical protein
LLLSKTTKLKVENLAQTTFRFSLLGFLPIDIAIPFRNGKERERENNKEGEYPHTYFKL